MRCFTASLRRNGCRVENSITHRFQITNEGIFASFCGSRVPIDRALFSNPNSRNWGEGRLVVWKCAVKLESRTGLFSFAPLEQPDSDALILIDADSDIECELLGSILLSGWDYVMHPTTGARSDACIKRLIRLGPGGSFLVAVQSPEEDMFGLPVLKGSKVHLRISYDGDRVKIETLNRELVPRGFSVPLLIDDLILFLGLPLAAWLFGIAAMPFLEGVFTQFWNWSGCATALFAFLLVARLVDIGLCWRARRGAYRR